ncbi:hypothetical protein ACFJGX_15715 [Hydrogenophaga sp. UC242_50]|uniref:hypothetical protein n=1 Tax=Hydrogenophaga sp. UC242_50 TaxID=3350169 RepID=UPI0036D3262D
MVSESNQTSAPQGPVGSKVAAELTRKVTRMPMDTGVSIPTRPCFRSRQALAKKGPLAKNTTGRLITQLAQRSSWLMSGGISPGAVTYAGHAYIITCIMQKPATKRRHSAWRVSRRRSLTESACCMGSRR